MGIGIGIGIGHWIESSPHNIHHVSISLAENQTKGVWVLTSTYIWLQCGNFNFVHICWWQHFLIGNICIIYQHSTLTSRKVKRRVLERLSGKALLSREGRNTDECFCWISNNIVRLIDWTWIICQLLSFDFSKFQLLQMFVRNLKEDPFVLHPVLLHFFSRSKAQFLKQEFDSNTNTSEILSFDTWQGYIYDIYKSCEASRCICWRRT